MEMKTIDAVGIGKGAKFFIEAKTSPEDTSDKALECGPLEYAFPCSRSKVLDFLLTFREFDYSISDIAKNSGLSFKTGLNEVRKLEEQDLIINSRNVGKAKMYKLNLESESIHSISKLVMGITTKRIEESIMNENIEEKARTAQAWKRMKVRKAMNA